MKAAKRQEIERRLIRKLIRIMKSHGWAVRYVWDGEFREKCRTEEEALDTVFSVDESAICFIKGETSHRVYIVLGNDGYDAISDYGYSEPVTDPADDFKEIMDGEVAEYERKLEEEVHG